MANNNGYYDQVAFNTSFRNDDQPTHVGVEPKDDYLIDSGSDYEPEGFVGNNLIQSSAPACSLDPQSK
jgi:hypothetical protein